MTYNRLKEYQEKLHFMKESNNPRQIKELILEKSVLYRYKKNKTITNKNVI